MYKIILTCSREDLEDRIKKDIQEGIREEKEFDDINKNIRSYDNLEGYVLDTSAKTPKEIAEDIKERYQAILGIVPGLKNVEVGVNRNESATSYDAVLIEDFDSWQDLAAYKADPIRDELTKYVDKFVDVRARVEYER